MHSTTRLCSRIQNTQPADLLFITLIFHPIFLLMETTQEACRHNYCWHQHYNKCYQQRLREIPYTIFPIAGIDGFSNAHFKCGNFYKSSIPTLAYENYYIANSSQKNLKHYKTKDLLEVYSEFEKEKQLLRQNTLVEDTKEWMSRKNAYALAQEETEKHRKLSEYKNGNLQAGRQRAIDAYNATFRNKRLKEEKEKNENSKWLLRLYRKLEEVARHIIDGYGETASVRERKLLLLKDYLDASFIKDMKMKDPKGTFQGFEELRTLMLKKKFQFEEERELQQINNEPEMSCSQSVNTTQGSLLSEEPLEKTNSLEQELIEKFKDFEELKKKWHLEDIEEVKKVIRYILTNLVIARAEVRAVRLNKQAVKIDTHLKIKKQKEAKAKQQKRSQSVISKKKVVFTNKDYNQPSKLSVQVEQKKQLFSKGSKMDTPGEILLRNKNYSEMFKTVENSSKLALSFRTLSKNQAKQRMALSTMASRSTQWK